MAIIDFSTAPNVHLIESSQSNPARYQVLKRLDNGTYDAVSPRFKCKDYFNDFANYKAYGWRFSCYNMQSDWCAFDANGDMYVYWTGLFNRASFQHNIKLVNSLFEKNWGFSISVEDSKDNDGLILRYPNAMWRSCYIVSIVAGILRNCNYENAFASLEDLTKTNVRYELGEQCVKMIRAGSFHYHGHDLSETLHTPRTMNLIAQFGDKRMTAWVDCVHDDGFQAFIYAYDLNNDIQEDYEEEDEHAL